MNEYLSVAEFAEKAGVSKQAIYKRLNSKSLKPYVKEINGVKRINSSAIGVFQPIQPDIQPISTVEQQVETAYNTDFLLAQLAEKDELIKRQQDTISQQNTQIQDLQRHVVEQAKELTEIIKKQSQQQENFQILLAQQQAQQVKSIENTGVSTNSTVEQQVEREVEQPIKRTFWQRLFGG